MIKALKDAFLSPCIVNLPVSHTEDIWNMCPDLQRSPCACCLKEYRKACFCLGSFCYLFTGVKTNATSCPCGVATCFQGLCVFKSVDGLWLQGACVVYARWGKKKPKLPYIYVCIKIQFNLQASKLNVNGLCVVAVPSAMWHGSPPSPRWQKQARLQFCWYVASPSAK